MNKKRVSVEHKLTRVITAISFGFLIILLRVSYLQLYAGSDFFSRAEKNYTRTSSISSLRGSILDCNGRLLATNRPVISLYWQGTGNRKISSAQNTLLEIIEQIIPETITPKKLNEIRFAERTGQKKVICTDITHEKLGKLMECTPNSRNLITKTDITRYYPFKSLACHILGYISGIQIDAVGKMGLERLFEETLRGQDGKRHSVINSFGAQLKEQEIKKALHGADIATTLDLKLQRIAEQSFPKNDAGVLILMDPNTGSIKASVSKPSFDPNMFLTRINPEDWQNLQEKKAFLNRSFNALYPPASTFKLVTLSAALEHGLVDTESLFSCKGHIRYCGRKFHCSKRYIGHGDNLDIKVSTAESCNILFYEIGKKINVDDLAQYAHRFGLGEKTGLLFPEAEGLIPTKEWKRNTKGYPWWPGETLHTAIGQSYLLATPIQVARMVGSIFTGNLIKPRILDMEKIEQTPVDIAPSTRALLKKSMRLAVKEGLARSLNSLQHMKLYAKTGTAELGSKEKNPKNQEHAWFTAYIKHESDDPLVLVIVVEHAGSSRVATQVAKQLLTRYDQLVGQ